MSNSDDNPLFEKGSLAELLFLEAPIAYSVLNAAGERVASNRRFWELLGYPKDTKLTVEDLSPPESKELAARRLHELATGPSEIVATEKPYVRGDGTMFWGRVTGRRVTAPNGEMLMLGVVEDIDSQVQLENQLREAAKDQSEFVARVSHELRNPLHTMAGLAELLNTSDIDPQARRQAGIIVREAQNLTSIVSDLLDIGKFGTGNLVIDQAPFSVRGLIDRSVRSAQAAADDRGLQLITTVDDALPIHAIGDAGRLGQVVDNLLGNAIKFTSDGTVTFDVRCGVDQQVHFSVIDTGVGIPERRQADIFEPFQRLNPSAPGAGLGLAIAGRLAKLMSGDLLLQDSGPHGSTFVLSVPLEETEAPTKRSTARAKPHGPKAGRILVVEDNLETQMLAAAQLKRLGYEFDIVDDGYRALEVTESTAYDAILMDWHLPGIDGLETTRRIRQREEREGRERIPIISVTARAMAADIEACRAAGADDFVAKPASIGRIGEVLETWAGSSIADTETPESLVDGKAFTNLIDELGDTGLVCSLAQTFLNELPRRVAVIVESGDDHKAAQLAAHTLKGTSAMVGAERLRAIAAQIEVDARDRSPVTVETSEALQLAAQQTTTEVTELIGRLEVAR